MARLRIYTTRWCGYCTRAKALLDSRGLSYDEVPLDDEIVRLHRAIRAALRMGIARQGATLQDYAQPDGSRGSMQHEFKVYGRGGEPCDRCGTPIDKIRVAGRGTWYCPRCQRLGYAASRSSRRPSRSRRQSSV